MADDLRTSFFICTSQLQHTYCGSGNHEDRTPTYGYADGDGGVREELASGLSDVLFMQQIIRKANHGALKDPLFRCVIVSVRAFCHWSGRTPLGPSCGANFQGGYIMLKILTALAASLAMLSVAAAADLPRKEPPPPAPPPVGKWPVGKAPIGKYPPPAPVVTKG